MSRRTGSGRTHGDEAHLRAVQRTAEAVSAPVLTGPAAMQTDTAPVSGGPGAAAGLPHGRLAFRGNPHSVLINPETAGGPERPSTRRLSGSPIACGSEATRGAAMRASSPTV